MVFPSSVPVDAIRRSMSPFEYLNTELVFGMEVISLGIFAGRQVNNDCAWIDLEECIAC